jgi:hypothetical protein
MADRPPKLTTQSDGHTYVHGYVVALLVLVIGLYFIKCQWPVGKMEGMDSPCDEWTLAYGTARLGQSGADQTSSGRRHIDQSQIPFQSTVSCAGALPGYMALNAVDVWNTGKDTVGFLGGPEAPLFSGPPVGAGMTGFQYMKAVHDAQQALASGGGAQGAAAAVAAQESFTGSSSKGGISDQLLMNALGGGGM